MTPSFDTFAICETLDSAWDGDDDGHDLIRTTPLMYDADGLPIGHEANQFFGLEAPAYLGGRA
jgi:hypothetical protein